MISWSGMSNLDIVEKLAEWEDMISSEEELSKKFDLELKETLEVLYCKEDSIAIFEMFSNWADAKTTDGEIHVLQYESYEYVGEYEC